MKKSTIIKTLLLGTMLLGGASLAEAACSVSTDSYGMTKVVWDFAIETKSGDESNNVTYYLDASTNAYVESGSYKTSRPYSQVSKIVVSKGRSIRSEADSDGRTGVIFSGTNYDGYVEFYMPFTGKLTITGKYLNKIGISDKSNSSAAQAYTTSGTNSTSLTTTSTVTAGHRLQIYNNSTTGGVAITTITVEPESTWDEDNVSAGDMDFTKATFIEGTQVSATGHYQVSSKGYKSVSGKQAVSDALIVTIVNGGNFTFDLNESNNYRGMKISGTTNNEYNYTTTKNGYLTITYNYGGERGSWYLNSGGTASKGDKTSTIWLTNGQRLQVVLGSQGIYIKSVTFTEVTSVPATMGKYGYTTFASTWPLNLSSLPSGLKAYYVKADGISKTNNKVTLTEANTAVPAGTGLILKGTVDETYQIPVVASGSALSGNKLVGCTSSTDITSSTTNYANFYVLVNTETQAELQNIATWVATNTLNIPAGKAYLDATGVNAARLSIAFEDETTGIDTVQGAGFMVDGSVYDLQGRRMESSILKKGLYIINGKKVIIK